MASSCSRIDSCGMSTLFQSVCNLSGSGNFFLVLLAFVKIVRLQGANAYIWAVLFEPRMKCADRNLPHSFFFKCAVEFVQHTVIALVLILWIISVGGSQEGELRIEVVCCTMTALLASIWGRIAIHELKKHLENSFTFCMVRSFPSIAMLFWPIAAGNLLHDEVGL